MNANILEEKSIIAQLDKKSKEMQSKIDHFENIESDITKCLTCANNCIEISNKEKEMRKQHEILSEEYSKQKRIQEDLRYKKDQLDNVFIATSEKFDKLEEIQTKKRVETQCNLTELKNEYSKIMEEKLKLSHEIEQNERIAKEFEFKLNDLKREFETEMFATMSDCLNLKNQVVNYCKNIKKSIS